MSNNIQLSNDRILKLKKLQELINYDFRDINLLNKALTHKSYANEKGMDCKNNERLEFLGDAVIDLVISEYFFKNFIDFDEGDLTKIRSALVNESVLFNKSKSVELGEYMLLGKGEDMTGGRQKTSILANVFEAVIASIYLDSGLTHVALVIENFFKKEMETVGVNKTCFNDYKSSLQEKTQNMLSCIPQYRIKNEIGPDHDKVFEIEVIVNNENLGTGEGKNKKVAEQLAAKMALDNLQDLKKEKL